MLPPVMNAFDEHVNNVHLYDSWEYNTLGNTDFLDFVLYLAFGKNYPSEIDVSGDWDKLSLTAPTEYVPPHLIWEETHHVSENCVLSQY